MLHKLLSACELFEVRVRPRAMGVRVRATLNDAKKRLWPISAVAVAVVTPPVAAYQA